jgi:tRNA-splicing ligase RtcB (3'-phosphate/5'-hydroxy nucleic acid ligase)
MNETIITNRNRIHSWCPDIEDVALQQMMELADQPFIFNHVCLMPDAHMGEVMPIGGVIASKDVILPVCVGVDIGCGMSAIKTSLKLSDFDENKRTDLLHNLERNIPVGFSHNDSARQKYILGLYQDDVSGIANRELIHIPSGNIKNIVIEQMATLGGGNHFCEIQYDKEENIWAMIHSGSRNIGHKICQHFNDLAKELNAKYYSKVSENIPFLPALSTEGKDYINHMTFALDFAFLNRKIMMDFVKREMIRLFKEKEIDFDPIINIHHNYASLENHFGHNVWVHRKGATLASTKTIGIIPGSCGTNSYIVRGLGNIMSYNSCSHGAGRAMGRKAFNREYNSTEGMKKIEKSMDGITHSKFKKERSFKKDADPLWDVSELPLAYKPISKVMDNQLDLVSIVETLTPIISMKG